MNAPGLTLATMLVGTLVMAPSAKAEGCPEARSLRLAGSFTAAEAAARHCLESDGEDVGTWLELSRALGLQERFEPALEWVTRGLERYPDDADLALWQVRLFAWQGRLSAARERFTAITTQHPELLQDRETSMLGADIRYWSHDWPAADTAFSSYLASWPDDPDAILKLGIARAELARSENRVELGVTPSILSKAGADEIATRITVMVRPWSELWLGAAAELRARDDAPGSALYGLAAWRGDGFAIDAGMGGALGGTELAPELSAWIEPSVRLARPLWASLRYWRLAFATGGANVLSPGIVVGLGPVELDLRYWLAIADEVPETTARTTHASLLRARWSPSTTWTFELGGGVGNATDYLTPRADEGAGGWLGLIGVRFSPGAGHRLSAGYVQRHESAGDRSSVSHELTLGWQLTL